jgi:hypothetical protein
MNNHMVMFLFYGGLGYSLNLIKIKKLLLYDLELTNTSYHLDFKLELFINFSQLEN